MDVNSIQLMAIEYCLVIMGLFLECKCLYLRKGNMNYFFEFVAVLNLFLICNLPIRLSELHLVTFDRNVIFWLYAASVVLMTFTMAHWFVFDMMQTKSKLADTFLKRMLCFIPAFLSIPLSIANYWTGWLYVIDESSQYTRGSLFFLQALISYAYFAVLLVNNFIHLIWGSEKTTAKKCLMACIPAVIGAALQIICGGSYLLAGTVMCAWLIYVEICLDRQKAYELSESIRAINDELVHSNKEVADNMHTILALSDIYHTLYEVDLINDTFQEIKAEKVVSDFTSQYTSAKECLKNISNALFDEGYVGIMNLMFDPDTMNELLADKNSYFTDAIAYYSHKWTRSTILVAERTEEGKLSKIVFTFQLIDDVIEQQKKLEEALIYEIHANEMKELFVQTAQALVNSIDAKDKYTRGHSLRVAEYSRKIAEKAGKSEAECEQVYFAGLLHDVGKIGIPDTIICKEGKLTDEEYNAIKLHPVLGNDILQEINRLPYLRVGAHSHHERYDGKGYPLGLKGEEIPELARIIAVADAYDAMTSKRSYRNTIPQQTVREELLKGMGTQFDPEFAKIMVHLIDLDIEYIMQEHTVFDTEEELRNLSLQEYRSDYSAGLRITDTKSRIHFNYNKTTPDGIPGFIFYDALDAKIHKGDQYEKKLFYHEYGEIKLDGSNDFSGVRANELEIIEIENVKENTCDIEMVKDEDHLYFEIKAEGKLIKGTLALLDNTRYIYVCITGTNCFINNIKDDHDKKPIKTGSIKRIADPVTYLHGPEGNIPSIQVDGYRTASSEGVLIDTYSKLTFDMKSLPFARLVWHCPFVIIYHSADGKVFGPDYREYGVVRINGESWGEVKGLSNQITTEMTAEFPGWEQWKEDNKTGRICQFLLKKEDNHVTLQTSNGGIVIENLTETDPDKDIYIALSGDQCVIENIHFQTSSEPINAN